MPSFLKSRKVHELAAITPGISGSASAAQDPDPAWRRLQRGADRAEARSLSPLRVGRHPLLCVGLRLDPQSAESAATAAGAQALKQGDRSLVLRIPRLDGAPELGPVVLKHYLPGRFPDPRDACARSKAVRSLLAARALQRRGFRVAEPLAAWSRPGCGSWLLLRALDGHEPLHVLAARLDEPARRALLADFADCLRRLHAAGVAYRDLKPSNVMVTAARGERFAFIDHDRNRFSSGPVPRGLILRDLAAVNAGLPPVVRAAERWQALARYDAGMLARPRWKHEVSLILLESARRRHRWVPRRLLGGA
jgi:hypothetical protein